MNNNNNKTSQVRKRSFFISSNDRHTEITWGCGENSRHSTGPASRRAALNLGQTAAPPPPSAAETPTTHRSDVVEELRFPYAPPAAPPTGASVHQLSAWAQPEPRQRYPRRRGSPSGRMGGTAGPARRAAGSGAVLMSGDSSSSCCCRCTSSFSSSSSCTSCALRQRGRSAV